jgi:hypothetical protein
MTKEVPFLGWIVLRLMDIWSCEAHSEGGDGYKDMSKDIKDCCKK